VAGKTMQLWLRLGIIVFCLSVAAVTVLLITSWSTPTAIITKYMMIDNLNIYLVDLRDPVRDVYVNPSHRSCFEKPLVDLELLRLRQHYDHSGMNIQWFQVGQYLSFEMIERLRCTA
jgi:hypothetical protein